jgi:aryl-alcohol dehydrogenase-like predicted oxidoreductase
MTAQAGEQPRPLGQPAATLSRIALGCGNFGGIGSAPDLFGSGLDADAAFVLMDAAWELGIRRFDTADAYGGGRSETIVGAWMADRGRRPLLTTKTYNPMSAGADHGLAAARVERQLHSSLERLGVDRVELYLAHEFDPEVAPATVLATFELLRDEGLVGAFGVSNYDAAQLRATLEAGPINTVQNSFSLLVRDDEAEVLPLCEADGVHYSAYSPLAGGWLTGKYRRGQAYPAGSRMTQRPEGYVAFLDDAVFDGLERLGAAAAARGISMAGLALSWLLGDSRVSEVVVGPMRPDQLEPVREALATPLSAGEREQIEALL